MHLTYEANAFTFVLLHILMFTLITNTCDTVITACDTVITACGSVITACGTVITACGTIVTQMALQIGQFYIVAFTAIIALLIPIVGLYILLFKFLRCRISIQVNAEITTDTTTDTTTSPNLRNSSTNDDDKCEVINEKEGEQK